MDLTAIYEQDGEWIMGYIVEIPGVNTQGRTLEECRENLRGALKEVVLARRQQVAADSGSHRIAEEECLVGQFM